VSLIERVALPLQPQDCGVNSTLMVQDVPAPTLAGHVLVFAKSVESVSVMPVMFSDVLPTLVSVAVWVPGFPLPKFMLFGTSFTVPTVSVTAAFAVLVASVTEVEAIVTVGLAGTLEGGV